MAVLITRMPSTGNVTNVTRVEDDDVEAVRRRWADTESVQVLSDTEFAALPRCPSCGEWIGFRRCADCR